MGRGSGLLLGRLPSPRPRSLGFFCCLPGRTRSFGCPTFFVPVSGVSGGGPSRARALLWLHATASTVASSSSSGTAPSAAQRHSMSQIPRNGAARRHRAHITPHTRGPRALAHSPLGGRTRDRGRVFLRRLRTPGARAARDLDHLRVERRVDDGQEFELSRR